MLLKRLKAALGREVLRHGPRNVELTEDGQTLLGCARRMLKPRRCFAERCLLDGTGLAWEKTMQRITSRPYSNALLPDMGESSLLASSPQH